MLIKICDAPMGAGKTSAAINYMNQHTEKKFLFVTPYLTEVSRICQACASRNFAAPEDNEDGKLQDLLRLVEDERCIASTHSLMLLYNDEVATKLKEHNYTLILDEVANVLDIVKVYKRDLQMLFNNSLAKRDEETEQIVWLDKDYRGRFHEYKELAEANRLIYIGDEIFAWKFPINIFESFNETIILTFMHECQIQTYCFNAVNADIKNIYVDSSSGEYLFSEDPVCYSFLKSYVQKIHICDNPKLNQIGDKPSALSVSWYKNQNKAKVVSQLAKNLYNYFRNTCKVKSDQTLWATFQDYQKYVAPNGYTKSYLSFNTRASNAYRDKTCLAYCVNVYMNPHTVRYFNSKNIAVNQDRYAISILIQWIWRSAIRDGKEINIYIPSKRMRELLLNWIEEVSK